MIPYDSLAAGDAIFDELLPLMSEALDIREVFPRMSEIVAALLRHDLMTMTFHDREGQIVIQAASNDDFPTTRVITVTPDGLQALNRPYYIVEDIARTPLPIIEPRTLNDRILAARYRSLLRVHVKARHERVGLTFWSKRPHTYSVADVPFARRVADHVALAMSHQQLAEAARQVAQAQARAERLETRVRSLTDELDEVRRSRHDDEPRDTVATAAEPSDLKTLERNAIADMLRRVGGNKSEAARRLGLSRTQLYVRLQRHRLSS
jgi:GAF domain-containing protein